MIKRVLSIFLVTLTITALTIFLNTFSYSQTHLTGEEEQKVLYNLPHPGLLPDNPLYFIKVLRDNIIDFSTRDTMKKAELYLLYADKKASMALALAQKGKNKVAASVYSEGEKQFLQIPQLLETSKKQGVSPSSEFITKLRLSNAKHQEVGEILISELSKGETETITAALKSTEEIKNKLNQW